MKKLLPILLTVLLLTGCGAAALPDGSAAGGTFAQASAASQEVLSYELGTRIYEDSVSAEDGTLLAQLRYEIPELRALRDGVLLEQASTAAEQQAMDAQAAFNAEFAAWLDDLKELGDWAKEHYDEDPTFFERGYYYTAETSYSAYQTDTLISILSTFYSFTGGVHPNTTFGGFNFDLTTGTVLPVPALGEDAQELEAAVTEEIIRQCGEIAEENGRLPEEFFWQDYQDVAANWPNAAVTFDAEGMTVTFSAYELAGYAAGPQFFRMDYAFLKPLLSAYGCEVLGLAD